MIQVCFTTFAGINVGVGTMRYTYTAIKSTQVYDDPIAHVLLYQDLISIEAHISRQVSISSMLVKTSLVNSCGIQKFSKS